MNKKVVVYLLLITAVLSGCQLAAPQAAEDGQDKLVGVFVTEEYVDVEEFDELILSNVNKLDQNKKIVLNQKSQKRIYGEVNDADYRAVTFGEYRGAFLIYTNYEKEGESYYGTSHNNQIKDISIHIDNENINVSGTLFVEECPFVAAYINPVYKTAEGKLYFTPGSGISADTRGGATMSMNFSEGYKVNQIGAEKSECFKIEVFFKGIIKADYYVIKQMGKDDQIVTSKVINITNIPSDVKIDSSTEYIMLEKHALNINDTPTIKRELIDKNDDYITIQFFNHSAFADIYPIMLTAD